MNKIDRYIFSRLLTITFFVLAVLICIFILIDFSENSDDFTDNGATMAQVWKSYYLNYIPEMVRLVSPVAVFVACLLLTGQMTERLEIIAIKASGISLYRLVVPYIFFGLMLAGIVSYLDAYVIPQSNADRIEFENEYLSNAGERIDRGTIYRQESDSVIITFNFFDPQTNIGHQARIVEYDENKITRIAEASRLRWNDSLSVWKVDRYEEKVFEEKGFTQRDTVDIELPLNLYPRDLARRSSDIYQLTYPEAFQYIESIRRVSAGGINLPLTQLYGRIGYPIAIFVVCLIGFALATEKRKGGRGFYISAGLTISFIYLAFMKVIEPFGAAGTVSPEFAAFFPHALFLTFGIVLLLIAKK
ncbi:MAG: LptF/LptG family permease [Balneolaceae bacterium]